MDANEAQWFRVGVRLLGAWWLVDAIVELPAAFATGSGLLDAGSWWALATLVASTLLKLVLGRALLRSPRLLARWAEADAP